MDVVLDTNVVISAAINPKGPPAEIIRRWRAQSFAWVSSADLFAELKRVIQSPEIRRFLAWDKDEIADFLATVSQIVRTVTPAQTLHVIKDDPADNRVLEAAIEAGADYIVTGDKALLSLETCEGIPIITPVRFLAVLQSSLPQD